MILHRKGSHRMLLSFSEAKWSKFSAWGKLLRYIPGATWPKFFTMPGAGVGGPVSSLLPGSCAFDGLEEDMRWPWPWIIFCFDSASILFHR